MKTVIVIQARIGSTRLPGKVMLPLAGKPLLQRMIERVRRSVEHDEIMVATSVHPQDEQIRRLCNVLRVPVYSGHPTDLLDRHYHAGLVSNADLIVKIPSDCPLIDPAVISKTIGYYKQHAGAFDFVSNLHPATYPDGNDVEVFPADVLRRVWILAGRPFEREHTTPYVWERPQIFRIGNVTWERGLNYSMSHRWTIDYPEDYEFIKTVYDELYSESRPDFSIDDILDLLACRPDIHAINDKYAGVNWYRHYLHELETITDAETRIV